MHGCTMCTTSSCTRGWQPIALPPWKMCRWEITNLCACSVEARQSDNNSRRWWVFQLCTSKFASLLYTEHTLFVRTSRTPVCQQQLCFLLLGQVFYQLAFFVESDMYFLFLAQHNLWGFHRVCKLIIRKKSKPFIVSRWLVWCYMMKSLLFLRWYTI